MQRPTQLRDVQKFTGCLASLSRFISWLREKALPLYQLMKKTTCFKWTDQADEAFLQLKRMLSTPPFLAAPTAKEPIGHFDGCEFLHVPRADNEQADALAWIGSTPQAIPAGVSLQCLRKPSIKPSPESESIFVPVDPGAVGSISGTSVVGPGTSASGPGATTPEPSPGIAAVGPVTSTTQQAAASSDPPPPNPTAVVPVAVMTVVESPSWAQPILNFLVSRELPADEILARQVQHRAAAYTIVNRELVRRSVTGVFQRCVEPEKGMAILRDIHQGKCGPHAASRSLVARAFRHSFFCPAALDDAKMFVQKCKGCQKFSTKQHQPASALKTIPITWPFAVWG
ncbi:uncharacterized protein, partial [Triticum aestivum]|uniref:uncharacterized protein n=1 Tax=Triticum aestivum TaxID=4565 RepID=UPI001D012A73